MPQSAVKTPPMIAPGILCPKCKGAMIDERLTKRTEKSPDYTCANMLCVQTGTNGKSYRTAVWEKDLPGNASAGGEVGKPTAGTPVSAPSADASKPKMRDAYKSLTEWVLAEIAPIYEERNFLFDSAVAAACTQTLFIQACKAGKVE